MSVEMCCILLTLFFFVFIFIWSLADNWRGFPELVAYTNGKFGTRRKKLFGYEYLVVSSSGYVEWRDTPQYSSLRLAKDDFAFLERLLYDIGRPYKEE